MDEQAKHSILIVDDEISNIWILESALKSYYTLYTAHDGRSALEMAKKHLPDLILLDVIMPDISGYEVLAELKKTAATMGIPVIFITGLSTVEEEEKGFLLGAVDYITKPFNSTIVRVRVRQHLQTLRQFRMIQRLSSIDPLTDIPNRRGFNDRMNTEWARAIRGQEPIGILLIDVDNFKIYNDTYGHPQGDEALLCLARLFRRTLERSTDFVARWGGEEFVVLLPGTDLNGAVNVAEQIRANTEATPIPRVDGSDTRVTVSIGAHSLIPSAASSPEPFISQADKALYAAKNNGKNRVVSYSGT
jgi:diguanylate cyclase (GGDEF)-like protein